jgi:hypothetical protein
MQRLVNVRCYSNSGHGLNAPLYFEIHHRFLARHGITAIGRR